MPSDLSQSLTEQYYAWDYRLRGYDLWPYPVSPEPPFVDFNPHVEAQEVTDDTRTHTLLSGLAAAIKSAFAPNTPPLPTEDSSIDQDLDFTPDLYVPPTELIELQIALPAGIEYPATRFEQLLLNLKAARYPIAFEIIGSEYQVVVQLCAREHDTPMLSAQLAALFPEAIVTAEQCYLARQFDWPVDCISVVDFGLEQACVAPLTTAQRNIDPLATVISNLAACEAGEVAAIQILFLPVREPWAQALSDSVVSSDGTPLFTNASAMLKQAAEKTAKPLFSTLFRTVVQSHHGERRDSLLQRIGGSLSQFNNDQTQGLIPLNNDGYPNDVHLQDIVSRFTHRSGMLLNSAELIGFAHLPQLSVTNQKLVRPSQKTKELPRSARGNPFPIGTNEHRGQKAPVTLSDAHRMRHCYVVGASGTGKTTLLLNLLRQDIALGNGVALLDPHGDLIDDVLRQIPNNRLDDVVLLDPADEDHPIGLNILDARSESEKTLLASDLVAVFRRLSTSWGDQMNAILANAITAILEHKEGGTLLTLRRFLIEDRFRRQYLTQVADSEVRYYWEKEYPLLRGKPQAPVLTRLDTFLRSKLIRHMVAQPRNNIDFTAMMNERKIFLAKLSHGAIGEENAHLLGTLLVTAINQAAQRRQATDRSERNPFYLYIDEFQNFVTPTMESILSGSRKFNLALTLAHQDLRQLSSRNQDVAHSVLSNPCTRICFRSGDADAATLSKGFSSFNADDLQSLGIGQAIVRVEQSQFDCNLAVAPPPTPPTNGSGFVEKIRESSRKRYGTPLADVLSSMQGEASSAEPSEKSAQKSDTPREKRPPNPKEEVLDTAKRTVSPVPPEKVPQPGRGGSHHRYLQSLVKKLALERGFKTEIEAPVLGSHGYVDVLLTREGLRIAVEITVTTPEKYETQNIQKCLAAGVDQVVMLGHDKGKLRKLKARIRDQLESSEKVHFLLPEEFLNYLDTKTANENLQTKTVRGYKVKVQYQETTKAEQKQKQAAIAKLIVDSMRRMKG